MRLLKHLFPPSVRRWFPADSMQRIAEAIAEGESRHRGEVMFAVEADLPLPLLWRGVQARQRAEHAFARLRTWDTEANNGVLLYLLLADHRIEIVADRGLRDRVTPDHWQAVCRQIELDMRAGQPETAIVSGIGAISTLLATHFPQDGSQPDEDELPNLPHVL
ncbi:TPM domain-containing protein [Pseudoxanthomonas dokdonensis]|uniref:Membrane protein n=1 Tax=Pseudoxanthomonas dokdonensis TaxID=344882 RepID=A0A0R0CMH7_9GAMM|nr:TPM domain-containing protein [Pseudoxanthomonas dokdonensis]KRG71229.1 membrane protein [Pseudoxanthomonas dokdonensis]